MNARYIFCFLLLASGVTQTQPVLTKSAYEEMLLHGTETWPALNAADSWFHAGTPGALDNTFSFESYAFEAQPAAITEYRVPGSFPYDTLFPGATHVILSIAGGSFTYYNYMKLDGDAMWYMGDAAGSEYGLFSSQVYDPPFPLYRFPLAVGDSLQFTGNRRDESGTPGRLDMQYKVESAGTLHTRNGSEQVLLLRRVYLYTDSVEYNGQPMILQQKWARLELANPNGAVSFVNADTSTIDSSVVYALSAMHIVSRAPSSRPNVAELPRNITVHGVYPSPLRGNTPATVDWSLAVTAEASVRIYDALGRLVARVYESGRLSAGRHEMRIPTHVLTPGAYMLIIRAGGAYKAVPLRVLH